MYLSAIYGVRECWLYIRHGAGLWGREGSKGKKAYLCRPCVLLEGALGG